MQNDTISRSALVAELENFKVTAGDPVIRLIIDRVIGIVKDHKAAEEAPPAGPHVVKGCTTCMHVYRAVWERPCVECRVRTGEPSRWEPSHEAV